MSEYILQAKDIHKRFGGVHALKGVSLDIKKGEIHCLAGENGCGKSTLIKIISGVYKADSGTIIFNAEKYTTLSPAIALKSGIQVIYQDFSIFPNLSVRENLALNTELMAKRKWVSKKRFTAIAEKALAQINVFFDLDELVDNLSVADKQLVAIARALLDDAKLIIMDEPTTALTKKEVESLFLIIGELQKKGIAILFVSHKMDEVFEISKRFSILRNGENVISGDTSELNDADFSFYMTGRHFKNALNEKRQHFDQVFFECKNLSYGKAFNDVSFKVYRGEILGITGLLGSGRTELIECLFGAQKLDGGSIKMAGQKVSISSIKDAIKLGIGYVPEDRLTEGLFLTQSITDNISASYLRSLASSSMQIINKNKCNDLSKQWIATLGIKTGHAEYAVNTLSGGNQQKVVLAKWLVRNLHLLLLNCPTAGVDIGAKYDIHAFIRGLAEQGLSVIVISDDLPEVIALCDRVLIMKGGRIGVEYSSIDEKGQQLSCSVLQNEVENDN